MTLRVGSGDPSGIWNWYWAARGFPRECQEHIMAKLIRRCVDRLARNVYLISAEPRRPEPTPLNS